MPHITHHRTDDDGHPPEEQEGPEKYLRPNAVRAKYHSL